MREITEIQKRLEKVSLDLKQSQDELRELSGKLAELERSLKLKHETANPINTEKSAIRQDTEKQKTQDEVFKHENLLLICATVKISDIYITDKELKVHVAKYIARVAGMLGLTPDDIKRTLNDKPFADIDNALK